MLHKRSIVASLSAAVLLTMAGAAAHVSSLHAAGARPQSPPTTAVPDHASLVGTYCVTCHNERQRTAGLVLNPVELADPGRRPDVWEKVARKLRAGSMPPVGLPRPEPQAARALVSWLESSLDRAAAARPNPGRTETFHRLNRAEYRNVVRDLLGLDIDVAGLLPPDDASFGFDNIADLLSVSPALLDRYMTAARRLSRLAVGLPPAAPVIETHVISEGFRQDDTLNQLSDELPFGSRGGAVIRHHFPSDGEYVLKITLLRDHYDYLMGLGERHQLDLRLDGKLIKRFSIGGEEPIKGAAPTGYIGSVVGTPEFENYVLHADDGLEIRMPITAGLHVMGLSFAARWAEEDGIVQPRVGSYSEPEDELFTSPAVKTLSITGPYAGRIPAESPTRRTIMVCQPRRAQHEEACARRILTELSRRAFRGFATDQDVTALLAFYRDGRRDGGFDAGIQFALERLLVDPRFLFRIERDPKAAPGGVYRLGDLELASRLSFFLWSTIPDDTLLDLATRGKLRDPVVLEREVRRMLADARVRALVENFAGQWLELRNLDNVARDARAFPEFDDNLREAFRRETELFFESQVREDRSVLDLLRADYTYLNERLARHYGIANVSGSAFRRVELPADQRGGLLGHGSILTITSPPNRTSPVFRGKWILDNLLGTPPPPPPANVPDLPDRGEGGKAASVRQRLEQHRRNAVCATCHAPMDPLGFALENFDAVGRWRTTEEGQPVDSSGVMPNGVKFEGPAGLRAALLADPEQFVAGLTEKLLAYGIGRVLRPYDSPATRAILRAAAPGEYRWSALIMGIVKSAPFQMRVARSSELATNRSELRRGSFN